MNLNDIQKWQIEVLGRNGGYSRRFIAMKVFNCSRESASSADLARISRHLKEAEIKLWDWRNGISLLAMGHAREVLNQTRRKRA